MIEQSLIQWTHYTGGPFLGCSPVSPGCANCYAWELMLARLFPIVRRAYKLAGFADWETRPVWGDKATRVLTKGFWKKALSLDRQAAKSGQRYRMFPSMIDWLDTMPAGIIDQEGNKLDPIAVLADFLDLIRRTPNLDWLLLTKRIENWLRLMGDAYAYACFQSSSEMRDLSTWLMDWRDGRPPQNIWLGVTAEDQPHANERVTALLQIPAALRFVSYEPALAPINFRGLEDADRNSFDALTDPGPRIDWIIVGGESGPKARPFNIQWARSVVAQCQSAGVACFVKQLGSNPITEPGPLTWPTEDPKGGDMSEWPEDLRVRQFPSPSPIRMGEGRGEGQQSQISNLKSAI